MNINEDYEIIYKELVNIFKVQKKFVEWYFANRSIRKYYNRWIDLKYDLEAIEEWVISKYGKKEIGTLVKYLSAMLNNSWRRIVWLNDRNNDIWERKKSEWSK